MSITVVYGYKLKPKHFLETFYEVKVASTDYVDENYEYFMHINEIIDLAKLYDKDPNWTTHTLSQTSEEYDYIKTVFKTYQSELHKQLYVCSMLDKHVIVGIKLLSLPINKSISLDKLSMHSDIVNSLSEKIPEKYKGIFNQLSPAVYCVIE